MCIYFNFLRLQLFQPDKVLCTLCCPGEVTSRCSSLRSYQMLTPWLGSAKLQMLLWSKTVVFGPSVSQGVLFLYLEPVIIPAKSSHSDLLNGPDLEFLRGFLVLIEPPKARMLLSVKTASLSVLRSPLPHASMQGLRPGSCLALCGWLCCPKRSSLMTGCQEMLKMT